MRLRLALSVLWPLAALVGLFLGQWGFALLVTYHNGGF